MLVSDAVQKAYSFFTVSMSTNQKMNGLLFLIVELHAIALAMMALELIEAGVTDRMHALDKPISIQFGVKCEDSCDRNY
jgi:hypothetical protein